MPPRILIVEDSRTEALRARLILERAGFQVSLASNGKEGLSQAGQEKPDLIMLDTVMPQMSGFETCGKLKLDPQTSSIPIIMLATDSEATDMPSGVGLDCFLTKPYSPELLVSKVKATTDSHAVPSAEPVSAAPEGIRRYQEELRRARQEIETANKSRSDFLANMSHELRTPLHEIIGMTELTLGTDLTDEQQGYLATVKTSSNALLSLINDVIEFSELEAGQLSLEEKAFELSEPLERTLEIMLPRATDKGLDLSTAISSQVPRQLVGDANRLRQVLSNLIANAIKFTERGEVTARVGVEALQGQEIVLHFRISDTGIGIPENRREIIFEPFQQADTSATRRFGGLGMGLAMAKQLVRLMGGRIWVESEPGKGSTFHFTARMKMQARAILPAAEVAPTAQRWPRPLQILVAEDSPTNQLIAKSSLLKAGHTVTLAVNGLEAVKAYEASRTAPRGQQFDLVLMDVAMPEMDGLDATRTIREKEKTLGGHISIVAMTAFATKEYHTKCLDAGMDAYVTKPVRIDELNKTLEPLMTQSPTTADTAKSPVDLGEALEVVGGDVDILRDAAALSLEEIPAQLHALKEAMTAQDAKGVEAKAHRLKGVMGSLGGMAAHEIGQRLETMGEQGNLAGGVDVVKAFEREIGRVVSFYSNPSWEQRARAMVEG